MDQLFDRAQAVAAYLAPFTQILFFVGAVVTIIGAFWKGRAIARGIKKFFDHLLGVAQDGAQKASDAAVQASWTADEFERISNGFDAAVVALVETNGNYQAVRKQVDDLLAALLRERLGIERVRLIEQRLAEQENELHQLARTRLISTTGAAHVDD